MTPIIEQSASAWLILRRLAKTSKLFWVRAGYACPLWVFALICILGLSINQRANANPTSYLAKKYLPIYSQIEANYRPTSIRQIETYGRQALALRGASRLYALWSVLFNYEDNGDNDSLRVWIARVQASAKAEHDAPLAAFAELFKAALARQENPTASAFNQDWTPFLDPRNPDLRLMALFEVLNDDIGAKRWAHASMTAQVGLKEGAGLGVAALPVEAELHEHYAYALSRMGFDEGAVEQMLQASMIDRRTPLPTHDLDRLYDLSFLSVDAGDLDLADYFQRIHFRLAQTAEGPDPWFWSRSLCALVARARQDWSRVLACTADMNAQLAAPKGIDAARVLSDRAMARARLGQLDGARADLAVLKALEGGVLLHDRPMNQLIQIYIDAASGHAAHAFETLDTWRIRQDVSEYANHRRGVSEVVAALNGELATERAQSAQLAKAAELDRRLALAWRLVAIMFGLLILGSLAWALHLRRTSLRLREAGRRAQVASAAKSAFLAVMSHELRTPLNGMLGMTQALKKSSLSADQHDLVHTLEDSSNALLGILNDVLDLAKIEAGRIELEPQPSDLRNVCESVIAVYVFAAQEHGNRIDFTTDDTLAAALIFDALRVRQCIANLVSNAVKFTHDGVIALHLSTEPAIDGRQRVRLDVSDSGVGMSPETVSRLFDAFFQADTSTTRRYGGAGLGLNITARLAQLMGGGVTVASEPGRGSTFTLTFLADCVAAEACVAVTADAETDLAAEDDFDPSALGLKVLVVDDHPVNRKVADLLLAQFGCTVIQAENGQIALDCLDAESFDLVLMDINMPIMDGLEATRRIRQRPEWCDLPVIALSANAAVEDAQGACDAGMNLHLAKPIRADVLLDVLLDVASHRRSMSANEPRRALAV